MQLLRAEDVGNARNQHKSTYMTSLCLTHSWDSPRTKSLLAKKAETHPGGQRSV